ncbi:hypothetical protein BAUCODRAFT_264981 [Baudoinia panamericana UAMH 10762]|uniref:Uncharacterized protein n=1 Tax=Baudoinia panamericana (strain UAMH 10762) TaxID=717646 RepID=M2M8Y8_BAUPA|nr:uncharacterized protein BAUCODRAFT_264981 [Baudoinia panamericana UAMH 10762]EMC92871.1 hypothetical protein BAUCODRAFT_264981 [Baudoinia panamericana UAMH 10762]
MAAPTRHAASSKGSPEVSAKHGKTPITESTSSCGARQDNGTLGSDEAAEGPQTPSDDEMNDDNDTPDDFALSGAHKVHKGQRLAGLDNPPTEQTVAGAVRDEGDEPDDAYTAVEDIADSDTDEQREREGPSMILEDDDDETDSDEYDSDGSSGLDSDDEGDTTDEETEEEMMLTLQQMRRRAALTPAPAPSPKTPTPTPTPTPASRSLGRRAHTTDSPAAVRGARGPRMGTFVVDRTRAALSADVTGKRIKLKPPVLPTERERAFWERAAKTASVSRGSTPRSDNFYTHGPRVQEGAPQPFTTRMTLGSMFGGNLDILRNNDAAGVGAEMYPAAFGRRGSTLSDMVNSDGEFDDLNMQDFIDLGNASDSEEPSSATASIMSPTQSDLCNSFSSLDPRRNESLLDHLDQKRDLVGAFRRNQNVVRHVSSLPSHPAKRASTSEYNALQKGRRAAANTPITPARKKRVSQDLTSTGAGVKKYVAHATPGRRPGSRGSSSVHGASQMLSTTLM